MFPVPTGFPQSINIQNVSTNSIGINWQPPPLPEQNGVIIGYVVNVTSLESGSIRQLTTQSAYLFVQNLDPFTVYSCYIAARTSVGVGPFSTVITVQTMEAGKLLFFLLLVFIVVIYIYCCSCIAPGSHPTNFTGSSLNSTHVQLNWAPPPESQINGVIREYRLNITEDATGIVFHYTTSASIRELVIGPLHPFYVYHCSVVAITVEQGPYTSVFTIQTEEDSKLFILSVYSDYYNIFCVLHSSQWTSY